jgi:hypothetical protein
VNGRNDLTTKLKVLIMTTKWKTLLRVARQTAFDRDNTKVIVYLKKRIGHVKAQKTTGSIVLSSD